MKIYKRKFFSNQFKQKEVLNLLLQNKTWTCVESNHVQVRYTCDDYLVLDIFSDTHAFYCCYTIPNDFSGEDENYMFVMERHTQSPKTYSGLLYKFCNIFISSVFTLQSSQYPNMKYTLKVVNEWKDTTYVKCERKVLSSEPEKYLEISCDINEDQIEFAKKSINCKFDYIQFLLN